MIFIILNAAIQDTTLSQDCSLQKYPQIRRCSAYLIVYDVIVNVLFHCALLRDACYVFCIIGYLCCDIHTIHMSVIYFAIPTIQMSFTCSQVSRLCPFRKATVVSYHWAVAAHQSAVMAGVIVGLLWTFSLDSKLFWNSYTSRIQGFKKLLFHKYT